MCVLGVVHHKGAARGAGVRVVRLVKLNLIKNMVRFNV
jgi:hypothetical protein